MRGWGLICAAAICVAQSWAEQAPDAQQILSKAVAAEDSDWKARTRFDFVQTERQGSGPTNTYRVTMLLGSRYSKLVAVNGRPLDPAEQAREDRKFKREVARRGRETPAERRRRIAKYRSYRAQEHVMLQQMMKAFTYRLAGSDRLDGHATWVFEATPRAGYRPPNQRTKALTGMRGKLWVAKDGYHWVKVEAEVVKPVSIEGFLAKVEPGTRFEIEKAPVPEGSWEPVRFSMTAKATILRLVPHNSQEVDTFRDYRPTVPNKAFYRPSVPSRTLRSSLPASGVGTLP